MKDPKKNNKLLASIASHSILCWGHINLLGEYDFSNHKLKDSVGIQPQNSRPEITIKWE